MENLTILKKEALKILRQLERCCEIAMLYGSEGVKEDGFLPIMITDIDLKVLKKGEDIHDIERYLQVNGINFSITFEGLNDVIDKYLDDQHPAPDFIELGRINGKNLEEITETIQLLIQKLTQKAPSKDGENIIRKGKRKITLPNFPPTEWGQVEIRFISQRIVYIKTDRKTKTIDFEGLGFCNDKNGKPNSAWRFLFELAENGGETSEIKSPIPDNIKQHKMKLADFLKKIFKNETDPFYDSRETNIYRIKINLIPPIKEENDPLGTTEYFDELSSN